MVCFQFSRGCNNGSLKFDLHSIDELSLREISGFTNQRIMRVLRISSKWRVNHADHYSFGMHNQTRAISSRQHGRGRNFITLSEGVK